MLLTPICRTNVRRANETAKPFVNFIFNLFMQNELRLVVLDMWNEIDE